MQFKILATDPTSSARAGLLETAHGPVLTPTYMPVGTYGPVKLLDVDELRACGAQVVLGNSLHLHTTATSELVRQMGGLAKFTSWGGPTLTDSGGYQVSFMWRSGTHVGEAATPGEGTEEGSPAAAGNAGAGEAATRERKHHAQSPVEGITEEGAKMRSVISGERWMLSPERAMEIQADIGADMVMAFDQPTFDTDSLAAAQETLARTHRWERRSIEHWKRLKAEGRAPAGQEFFPIIQGGSHRELRRESTQHLLDYGTTGIAIAGESIGISPAITAKTLEMVRDLVPAEKPFYAMGLGGGPEGFFEAVLRGVDMFDNTSPTRLGRCGFGYLSPEAGGAPKNHYRVALKKAAHRTAEGPIDPTCGCKTCRQYSRAYLRHLFRIEDPLGMRLVSFHNVWFMCQLSREIHAALLAGKFTELYRRWVG